MILAAVAGRNLTRASIVECVRMGTKNIPHIHNVTNLVALRLTVTPAPWMSVGTSLMVVTARAGTSGAETSVRRA